MSNDATNTTDTVSESDYSEQVRQFKLMLGRELGRLANQAGACSVFDVIANESGLSGRESYVGERVYWKGLDVIVTGESDVTGEPTEEDAKRWALNTSRALVDATEQYGYREVYDRTHGRYVTLTELLEFFGMPTKKSFPVRITGTFDVTLDVVGWEETNLIDNVNPYDVSAAIAGAINRESESVQWKAQRADVDGSE